SESWVSEVEARACQALPGPRVLVLEVHERLAPRLRGNALAPLAQLAFLVRLAAQPEVAPAGGGDARRLLLVGLSDAERDIALPQRVEHRVIVPRRVPELDRRAHAGRYQGEQVAEPVEVLLHVRRQSEQDRAARSAERFRYAV